jgi:uncharacterized membrane protein YkvA (DUF1232 family)
MILNVKGLAIEVADTMNFSLQGLYDWYRGMLRNPKYRWWVVLASVAYIVSPIDISPDIFPVIGWIDDTLLVGILVAEVSQIASAALNARKNSPTTKPTESTETSVVDTDAVRLES